VVESNGFDVTRLFKQVLYSESSPTKRRFVSVNGGLSPDCLCSDDVMELWNNRIKDAFTKDDTDVPWCALVYAGFSCSSISRLNINAKFFHDAVRMNKGKTGQTLIGILGYVHAHSPFLVLLENIPSITDMDESDTNNSEELMRFFESAGYFIICFTLIAKRLARTYRIELTPYAPQHPKSPHLPLFGFRALGVFRRRTFIHESHMTLLTI
jgi:site-specific DNA-cytosine methylase